MRWFRVVLAATALAGGLLLPVSAVAARVPAAVKLHCSAAVSNKRPKHEQTVDVKVTTVADAHVAANAHFKTGRVRKTARADSAGHAQVAFKVRNSRYGIKVPVTVRVTKGSGSGTCATSFTPTAPPKIYKLGSCRASGEFAECAESGTATKPVSIWVHVTAKPNQSVLVIWDDACSVGTSVAGTSGQFTATTPIDRKIAHPYKHPDSCDVTAGGGVNNSGSIHVWMTYDR
jgi:hypothetical protein